MNKIFLVFILVLFFSPCIMGLGVTPARTTVNFEPGLEKSVTFSIINSEKKDMNLLVSVQGDLAEYVTLRETSFTMSAIQESREVSSKIKLPQGLSPGLHTAQIIILQEPEKGGLDEAYIGASLAVVHQIYVHVSYPGKYAEADLSVFNLDDGNTQFVVPVISRGDFDLISVKANIDIFTSLNEKVATLNTNEIGILSGERKEVTVMWNTSNISSGPYRAVATLIYDESTLTLERSFNVGQKRLRVESIEVNNFVLGDIAKFEVLVANEWGEKITEAYLQMVIRNTKGEVMADFKSQTYDIEPLEKNMMITFWDTQGIRVGTYDSSLFLNYGVIKDEQKLKLEVKEESINIIGIGYVISEKNSKIGESRLVGFLVIAVILLILVNIGWFFFLRKRLKK